MFFFFLFFSNTQFPLFIQYKYGGTEEIDPSLLTSLVQRMGHDDDQLNPSVTSDILRQLCHRYKKLTAKK